MVRRVRHWATPFLGAALMTVGFASMAQEPKTTTEKLKEEVGSAVSSIKKGAASASDAIKAQFVKAKEGVVKLGIEGRVYARLHWDKALATSKIELAAPKPGVIAVSGTVPDAKAKAKAIELTTDTTGVTEVIDQLTIAPSASTAVEPAKP